MNFHYKDLVLYCHRKFRPLSKLPYFSPISVGNHAVSDQTQTHTPIEKIIPQKVAKNFYTSLREKGNQNPDFYHFSRTQGSLKKSVVCYRESFKGPVL